jgi:mannitol-specific phosphotransferase system IIBC component
MAVEFERLDEKTRVIFLVCLIILTYLLAFSMLRKLATPRSPYEYTMGFSISSQGYAFMQIISVLIAICVTFFVSVNMGKVKVPTVEEIVTRREKVEQKEKVSKVKKRKRR